MAPPRSETYYGSISKNKDNEDEETAPLAIDEIQDEQQLLRAQKRRCRPLWIVLLLLTLCLIPIVISFGLRGLHPFLHPHHQGTTSSTNEHDKHHQGSYHLTSPFDMEWLHVQDKRLEDAMPSQLWYGEEKDDGERGSPLPTNSWYLNLLSHRAAHQPDDSTRVYTIPYIIDTAVSTAQNMQAGIRVHWPVVSASTSNVQMVDDFKNGLALGTTHTGMQTNQYRVVNASKLSPLGVSLEWNSNNKKNKGMMRTHIVRGMPYATMQYFDGALPHIYSYNGPDSAVLVDTEDDNAKAKELPCSSGKSGESTMQVNHMVQLHFVNSDFTWAVFFSRPVKLRCTVSDGPKETRDLQLSVVSYDKDEDNTEQEQPLTVRLALINQCTTGKSDITQHCLEKASWKDPEEYETLLKQHTGTIPTSPQIDFDFMKQKQDSHKTTTKTTKEVMTIDWGAQTTTASKGHNEKDENKDKSKLLMFALPHHQEQLLKSSTNDEDDHGAEITKQCINTFHGPTCLVLADRWKLDDGQTSRSSSSTTGGDGAIRPMSFTAPRPPDADSIPLLADSLARDIQYRLSSNMLRGASDTYFSGKILARLARVILIAHELQTLASAANDGDSSTQAVIEALQYDDVDDDDERLLRAMEAAASVELPSEDEIADAVEKLKHGVEVWLSDKAEASYVYDASWGGLVNCGCNYVGKGENGVCNNTFPDCPALVDVNEDFGNGYYNDHHYHYGYHIYAAAVVAKFDSTWGEENFDRVLLYVRDFANPFPDDEYFTPFRQKDWFLGSSWASGIVSAENSPHGRNEESSSEAIAAYEAVTLFGSVMVDVFTFQSNNDEKLQTARIVRDAGQLLTATEIRATNRYWHVWSSDAHTNTYPEAYKQPVVGMLYDTMASFQTWFAPQAVVSYGIQLIPFTPVTEQRDDPEWAAELYPLYDQSCKEAGDFCVKNGWSILQAGLCSTAGNPKKAMDQALAVPPEVFDSLGGVGNSLSNTIWYIATRKPSITTTI